MGQMRIPPLAQLNNPGAPLGQKIPNEPNHPPPTFELVFTKRTQPEPPARPNSKFTKRTQRPRTEHARSRITERTQIGRLPRHRPQGKLPNEPNGAPRVPERRITKRTQPVRSRYLAASYQTNPGPRHAPRQANNLLCYQLLTETYGQLSRSPQLCLATQNNSPKITIGISAIIM